MVIELGLWTIVSKFDSLLGTPSLNQTKLSLINDYYIVIVPVENIRTREKIR